MTPILRCHIHAPFEFYTLTEHYPETIAFEPYLLPIWEKNGDVLYGFVNDGSNRFVEQFYELPADQSSVVATSYQQFLVSQFADFYSFECSPEELASKPLAAEVDLLEFKHDDLLRATIIELCSDPSAKHSFEPEDVASKVLAELQ